jgi:integrase
MGYDMEGKKIVETTTYKPDSSLTLKQQEKAVEKFAMEFEDKIKNGKLFCGEKLSFEEFAEKWLDNVKQDLAYGTYENYEALLRNRIIPHFKGYKLAKIKLPMIEDFYRIMINEYAYSSVKKIDILMSNMFKTAIRWEMVEANPCSLAKLPKKKDKPNGIKFFTPQQAIIFQKSLDMTYEVKYKGHYRVDDTGLPYFVDDYTENKRVPTQCKVFFNIALLCGMRRGEILALHWSDIDFEDKAISISKSVTKTEHGIDYKEPKTRSSFRTITLPETLVSLLKQYKKEYNLTRLQLGDTGKVMIIYLYKQMEN